MLEYTLLLSIYTYGNRGIPSVILCQASWKLQNAVPLTNYFDIPSMSWTPTLYRSIKASTLETKHEYALLCSTCVVFFYIHMAIEAFRVSCYASQVGNCRMLYHSQTTSIFQACLIYYVSLHYTEQLKQTHLKPNMKPCTSVSYARVYSSTIMYCDIYYASQVGNCRMLYHSQTTSIFQACLIYYVSLHYMEQLKQAHLKPNMKPVECCTSHELLRYSTLADLL